MSASSDRLKLLIKLNDWLSLHHLTFTVANWYANFKDYRCKPYIKLSNVTERRAVSLWYLTCKVKPTPGQVIACCYKSIQLFYGVSLCSVQTSANGLITIVWSIVFPSLKPDPCRCVLLRCMQFVSLCRIYSCFYSRLQFAMLTRLPLITCHALSRKEKIFSRRIFIINKSPMDEKAFAKW